MRRRIRTHKAEPRFKLVMSIREFTAGMDSPEFAAVVERYAAILEKMGRYQDAEKHKKLAVAVRFDGGGKKAPAGTPVKSNVPPVDMIPSIPPASSAADEGAIR